MHLYTAHDTQLDGPADTLLGTALFAFDAAPGMNERHECFTYQRAELVFFQIGALRLSRSQVALAVGEDAVSAWESVRSDEYAEGVRWDEVSIGEAA